MITHIKKTSKIEALSRDWTHKRALKSQKKKWPEGLLREIWMESTGNFLQFTVWDSYSSDRSVDIYENLWEHTDLFYNL